MRILEVTLKNFRPFYDEVNVPLNIEEDKPLIFIIGKNDRGKTAFLEALKFCLYGYEGSFQQINTKWRRAINRRAATEGDGETRVTVEFIDNDTVYRVSRFIEFEQVDDPDEREPERSEVTVTIPGGDGGEDETIIAQRDGEKEYNQFMNNILPASASNFFFFDGEEVGNRYAGTQEEEEYSREDIREAIETVLGIQQIQKAIDDMDNNASYYNEQYLEAESDREDLDELKDEKGELEDELSAQKTQLDTEQQVLENKEEALEKVENKIADAVELVEKQDRIDDIDGLLNGVDEEEADTDEEEEGLYNILERKKEELQDYHTHFGSILIGVATSEVLDKVQVEQTAEKEKVINDLLKPAVEKCLCGNEIGEVEEEILEQSLENFQSDSKQAKYDLRQLASKHQDKLQESSDGRTIDKLKTDYHELYSEVRNLEERIEDLEEEQADLEGEIDEAAMSKSDVEDLREEKSRIKEEIGESNSNIDNIEDEISRLESEISSKEDRIDSMGGATEEEERYRRLRNLCRKSRDAWKEIKEGYVESRRKDVQDYATEVLRRLTNKGGVYKGLEISENYELDVVTSSGTRPLEEQDPSQGARQIIAYAFIAGLNRWTARNAPVVIDTPVGRLDPTHKENLINYLPEFKDQVIMLYQPDEFHKEDLHKVKDQTSRHLRIRQREGDPKSSVVEPFEPEIEDEPEALVQ
jgi:DNA sulfur modification protein DndD